MVNKKKASGCFSSSCKARALPRPLLVPVTRTERSLDEDSI